LEIYEKGKYVVDFLTFEEMYKKNNKKFVKQMKKMLKESANDPDSIKDVKCELLENPVGCVECSYRGKNLYNAYVLNSEMVCFSIEEWKDIYKSL